MLINFSICTPLLIKHPVRLAVVVFSLSVPAHIAIHQQNKAMDPNKFLEKIGATQDNMPLDGSTDSEIRPPPVSRDPTPQTIPINYTMEYGSQAPTLGMVISPWPNAVKHNARGEIAVLLEQFGKHSAENAHIVDSQYFPFPWGLDACKKMLENKKMQYDRTIWRTALLFFPMWVYTPTLKMLMNSDQTEPKWMAPIVLTSELLMEYMCALDIQRFNKDVPAAMRSESLKRHESMLEKRTNLYVENCHLTAQFKQLYDRRDEEGFDPTQHAEVLKLFATFTTMHTIDRKSVV